VDAGQSFYKLTKEYSVNDQKKRKEIDGTVEGICGQENADLAKDGNETAGSNAVASKDDKGELITEEKMVEGSISW
jgi:hypothetical protein